MPTSQQQITKLREKDREGKTLEERQTMAAENMADTLEALRTDIVLALSLLSAQRKSGL